MKQTLYGLSGDGKIKEWTIDALQIGTEEAQLIILSGYQDGKKVQNTRFIKGKNIGKSNETSAYQQALFDLDSRVRKQKDKGYKESIEELDNTEMYRPMLAQTYEKDKIGYPLLFQPKLNGVRCIVERDEKYRLTFTSRGGKKYTTLDHLIPDLLQLLPIGVPFDGEVYKHGWPLQRISSAIKKKNEDTLGLQYIIYDMVETENTAKDRLIYLINSGLPLFNEDTPVSYLGHMILNNEEELDFWHKTVISVGYEGSILRDMKGLYEINKRSKNLLKKKDFKDEEFKIVDYKSDVHGRIIFVCEIEKEGLRFDPVPSWPHKEREEAYKNGDQYIGKMLTVRYLEKSMDGIPQGNPVGLTIRDYE